MGFNFRKSVRLGKGVRLNYSKSGPSISFGKTGLRMTVNSRGKVHGTVGLPGSGMYYKKEIDLLGGLKKLLTGSRAPQEERELPRQADFPRYEQDKLSSTELRPSPDELYLQRLVTVHQVGDEEVPWQQLAQTKARDEVSLNRKKLAQGVLAGQEEALLAAVTEVQPFHDLTDFGSDFEVGFTPQGLLAVTFNVNESLVIPEEISHRLKSGKLSKKALSKTRRMEIMRDYVASTSLRVARDLLALLPLDRILIHAEETMVNPATGHKEDVTILSAEIPRQTLMELNFEQLEPFAALSNFKHSVDFKRYKGFQPVLPIQ